MDKPVEEVHAVVLYNNLDDRGNYVPLRVEIGSWVTLRAAVRGPWSRDARIHGPDSFAGAWKAQILGFRFKAMARRGRDVLKLDAIKVRHAYQRRQLLLDPATAAREPRGCNLLYQSYWDDWVDPTAVMDVILMLHHEVGEAAVRNGRSHKTLLENGTFFLKAVYVPQSGSSLYGSLEELPLPALDDPYWPLPDMHTSEAFRLKLATDISEAMKGGTGSKSAHVKWFMPVHVMVDLFAVAENPRRTATMYVFKSPAEAILSSLMDVGWDEKFQAGQDVLKCVVSKPSMIFRYHLARQVLYLNFQYVRYRKEGLLWIPIDQAVVQHMICVTVEFQGKELPGIEVGSLWPVSHIREEISILLPREAIPDYYDLVVKRPGFPDFKINARSERSTEIGALVAQNSSRFKIVQS